jgi:hypothetical protein
MGSVQSDELAEVDLSEEEMDAMVVEGEAVEVTGPPVTPGRLSPDSRERRVSGPCRT